MAGEMFGQSRRSLKELLSTPVETVGTSYFQVPKYQRKYVWEKENQISKFIEDIFENIGKAYFMGPLILCSEPSPEIQPDISTIEVVDGQQRLITFAIFIRCLMDYIEKRITEKTIPENLVKSMHGIYFDLKNHILKNQILKGEIVQNNPVIKLSPKINQFFKNDLILSETADKVDKFTGMYRGKHYSIVNMIDAYIKIWQKFETEYDSKNGDALLLEISKLKASILDQKIFLVITVHNDADAYTVFETINWRGKPLALSDLIRNLCFKRIEISKSGLNEDDLDSFESEWDDAELLVNNFAEFIWHSWVSRFGSCPQKQVFKAMQNKIKGMSGSKVFDLAGDFIFHDIKYYQKFETPDMEANSEKRRCLKTLEAMDATRCYPLLLAIDYVEDVNKSITIKDTLGLFKIITSLTFWYSGICNSDAKKLESVYHELAPKVRTMTKENSKLVLEEIRQKLIKQFPSEDACESQFTTRRFTDNSFVKTVLYDIEMDVYQKVGELTLKGSREVHLEHILPKRPDSSWKTIFVTDKDIEDFKYRFGNLTLLAKPLNYKIKNLSFEIKRKAYEGSKCGMTREIYDSFGLWDKDSINARSKQLFIFAKNIWPIL